MVIDTSALTAIMGNEPERRRFNEWIEAATDTYVSAASLLETRWLCLLDPATAQSCR